MQVPIPPNKVLKLQDLQEANAVVELDGVAKSDVIEAKTGPRGHVTFVEKDKYGNVVLQSGKPVHKKLYGHVAAWKQVEK